MDSVFLQILIGSYGALLLLVVSLLVRVLWKMNEQISAQDKDISHHSYIIKEIKGEDIPTIRIEVKKLEDRTDSLEVRADRLEQAVNQKD